MTKARRVSWQILATAALFITGALALLQAGGCSADRQDTETTQDEAGSTISTAAAPSDEAGSGTTPAGISLLKKIEIPGGARPEIIAAGDRVYIVYLDVSQDTQGSNSFKVKIFDRDLTTELYGRTLVASPDYGRVTDIRLASDGSCVYAFYEVAGGGKSYLMGARYALDETFSELASKGPITTSAELNVAQAGDEKLDDPAPLIADGGIYVMTRYKAALAREGDTRFKLRRLDRELNLLDEFDLDLSAVIDGGARQSSLLSANGSYYLATASTTGEALEHDAPPDAGWLYPADVVVVTLDRAWRVTGSKVIASEPGYTEAYVTGLEAAGSGFLVTYNQVKLPRFSSAIKGFDGGWNQLFANAYKTVSGQGGLRPSLEVSGRRVYAGNDQEKSPRADIYLFEMR